MRRTDLSDEHHECGLMVGANENTAYVVRRGARSDLEHCGDDYVMRALPSNTSQTFCPRAHGRPVGAKMYARLQPTATRFKRGQRGAPLVVLRTDRTPHGRPCSALLWFPERTRQADGRHAPTNGSVLASFRCAPLLLAFRDHGVDIWWVSFPLIAGAIGLLVQRNATTGALAGYQGEWSVQPGFPWVTRRAVGRADGRHVTRARMLQNGIIIIWDFTAIRSVFGADSPASNRNVVAGGPICRHQRGSGMVMPEVTARRYREA